MRQLTSMPLLVSREIDCLSGFCKTFNSPIGLLTDETLSVALDMICGLKFLDDNPTPPLEVLLHLQVYFISKRLRKEWELFKRWKNVTQALGEVQALEVGDTLKVKAHSAFGNHHFPMHSPYPKVPLPAETLTIIMVQSRSRDNNVDTILVDSNQNVAFTISTVKCCKPSDQLNNLQFITDLARTEEAIYNRLDNLQGSMIPHFYDIPHAAGCYQFELPNSTILWGLLAKFIDCSTLQHIDASEWSVEAQINFLTLNLGRSDICGIHPEHFNMLGCCTTMRKLRMFCAQTLVKKALVLLV
ncbi:hypothetical protein OBBRIDRAFT_804948 [Obba rivulosa]|uniref:Uncharacterized protein n=1 Tax=Obba rivulosa TaxID=1052685 RepID=A0A8E2B0U6_9APHY|nr:hypothetical protein OBBRIDRAFT_804948 [Obba rivulosa]